MDKLKKLERLRGKLLPGEERNLWAFAYTQSVVESIAVEEQGFKPDTDTRPMTGLERITEFDSLTIEQKNGIIERKGMAWFLAYTEEIQKLKDAIPSFGG